MSATLPAGSGPSDHDTPALRAPRQAEEGPTAGAQVAPLLHAAAAAAATSAPGGRLPSREPSGLPLSPQLGFAARYRVMRAPISAAFDAFSLAIALVSTWRYVTRVPLSRSPAAEAYLLALGALSSGCLAAYLAGRRWRARAAYTASLEVTAVALRLMLFGMPFGGVGWQQFRYLLDHPPVPAVGGGWLKAVAQRAGHVVLLLFASGAPPIVHATLCRPMRLWLSVAVQVALVADSMSWAGHLCTAGQLTAPAARAHTRVLYGLLGYVPLLLPLPMFSVSGLAAPADAQCATLLRFFQLVSGLASLVWQAASQAPLHAAHQRERREAGLPPERGISARLYALVADYADPEMRPHLWLAAALAVGLCWQLALGVSLPPPPP